MFLLCFCWVFTGFFTVAFAEFSYWVFYWDSLNWFLFQLGFLLAFAGFFNWSFLTESFILFFYKFFSCFYFIFSIGFFLGFHWLVLPVFFQRFFSTGFFLPLFSIGFLVIFCVEYRTIFCVRVSLFYVFCSAWRYGEVESLYVCFSAVAGGLKCAIFVTFGVTYVYWCGV